MFDSGMIAPCGLDCTICHRAVDPEKPCMGCRGPDEHKTDFCRYKCLIKKCDKRRGFDLDFCDACPEYPCEEVMEKETRYTSQYPLTESPLTNLKCIREDGMSAFIKVETERWTCGVCGGAICVHSGTCAGCGKTYGDQTKNHENER